MLERHMPLKLPSPYIVGRLAEHIGLTLKRSGRVRSYRLKIKWYYSSKIHRPISRRREVDPGFGIQAS